MVGIGPFTAGEGGVTVGPRKEGETGPACVAFPTLGSVNFAIHTLNSTPTTYWSAGLYEGDGPWVAQNWGSGTCRVRFYDYEGNVMAVTDDIGEGCDGGSLSISGTISTPFVATDGTWDGPLPDSIRRHIDGDRFTGNINISPNLDVIPDTICSGRSISVPFDIFHPCAEFLDLSMNIRIRNKLTDSVTDHQIDLNNAEESATIDVDVPNSFPTGTREFFDFEFNAPGASGMNTVQTSFDIPNVTIDSIDSPRNICLGTGNIIPVIIRNVSNCLSNIRARLENNTTGEVVNQIETRIDAGRTESLEFSVTPSEELFDLGSIDYSLILERQINDGSFDEVSRRDFNVGILKPSAAIVG